MFANSDCYGTPSQISSNSRDGEISITSLKRPASDELSGAEYCTYSSESEDDEESRQRRIRPPPGESGMEKGWVPEVIVAACRPEGNFPLTYIVKYRHKKKFERVPSSICMKYWPQLVISFYEREVRKQEVTVDDDNYLPLIIFRKSEKCQKIPVEKITRLLFVRTEAHIASFEVRTYVGNGLYRFIVLTTMMNLPRETSHSSSASCELKGVIVKLENCWITISVVFPMVAMDSFEVKLKNGVLSEVLKLGSWVVLCSAGLDVYEIIRQCSEMLPTYVYNGFVLLKTNICFQERGQEGYGNWVWSPDLGRVAAVCHERYKPKQNYVALVSRKPSKYQRVVEYNWMLTKYIEEPNFITEFDVVFQKHRIYSGRKSFNREFYNNHNGCNCSESTIDGARSFPLDELEEKKHKNPTSNNIYAIITKVVSNPNVREAMQKYRPKEFLSMCEALNLKFHP
ncbi:unnamed protein product [Litomosoides sigmodontis]|uniref:Chromo shadow domain-containing protein n=1 Tax=Litomosoides sigmodontis TaxID=42156 RepID=A0A3P6S1N3_LITSI|nr:unnamed protein product [Litomosoides sigmodontis]